MKADQKIRRKFNPGKRGRTFEERFWEKVDRRGPDECWLWAASIRNGYGQIWNGYEVSYSHRAVFELVKGPIPLGMFVCHSCDVRACCNPAHLWLGTQAENIADCVSKGRQSAPRGEDHRSAKLTEEKVKEIRASSKGSHALAREHGVSQPIIVRIRQRKLWRHI